MNNGITAQFWEGFMNFLSNKIIVELILIIEKFCHTSIRTEG